MSNFPSHVLNNSSQFKPHAPENLLFDFLKTSTGSIQMIVDASVASAEAFEYVVPAGKIVALHRVNFVMQDGGMSMEDFGAISGGLTTGLKIEALDSSDDVLKSFTNSVFIQKNNDFGYLAGSDVTIHTTAGDDSLFSRWTISKAGGPLRLEADEKFRITVQDSLSPITSMRAVVQGLIYDT